MGIPSDRRFLRAARRQIGHLFPELPARTHFTSAGPVLRGDRVALRRLRSKAPGRTTISCSLTHPGRVRPRRETARRSDLAEICGYGYSRSHSRWFWGCRLHLVCAPDGTPRASRWPRPTDRSGRSRSSAVPRAQGGETIVCDKGYAGKDFARKVAELGATSCGRPAAMSRDKGPHLAPIRQRIESVFWTCKDLLSPRAPRCPHSPRTWWCASSSGCSPLPPVSISIISLAVPAGRSSITLPDVASII